jgi:hypothetical protein
MLNRNINFYALLLLALLSGCATAPPDTTGRMTGTILSQEDANFIERLAINVINAARVAPGASVAGQPPNSSGETLIRPSGAEAFPAFWVRDHALAVETGLISLEEQRHAILQTAFHQQDGDQLLASGARIPEGSIPDHITFEGVPHFFPSMTAGINSQGGDSSGDLPSYDSPFYFIHMAFYYVQSAEDYTILQTEIRDRTLLKRLQLAYTMPPHRQDTGLVVAAEGAGGVNSGYTDTVEHTGELLFSSLLKLRAAIEMALLMDASGNTIAADLYREDAEHIRDAIANTFVTPSGYLAASTGRGSQPDVWGTAVAVYFDALPPEQAIAASQALANGYRSGAIAWRGRIRHVPENADASRDSAWDATSSPMNRNQNGAYWALPVGWVCYAMLRVDAESAEKLAAEFVESLRSEGNRAPFACAHPKGNYAAYPAHTASIAAPMSAFIRLAAGR